MQSEYCDMEAETNLTRRFRVKLSLLCLIFFSLSLCFAVIGTAEKNIVINEILFNPSYKDAGKEWVELYNPTNNTTNINGWTISNRTGAVIVTLPNWNISRNGYLVVHFGNGTNEGNFTDGIGNYYTNKSIESFNNTKDDCALYTKIPNASAIIDFVSWSDVGTQPNDKAYDYAVKAGIWNASDYLDINWTKNAALDGESIGRDGKSTDTNTAKDWCNQGGIDAYFPTPGSPNQGPLFSIDKEIFLTQTVANINLIHYGFNIINSSHEIIRKFENENDTYVDASHNFIATYDNNTILFNGVGIFHWKKINQSTSQVDLRINLTSDYGEQITINYSLEEIKSNNLLSHTYEIVNSTYSIQNESLSYYAESQIDAKKLSNNILLTTTNQSINDNSRINYKRIIEKVIIHSDVYRETWINSSDFSKLGNNTSSSMHFNTSFDSNDPSSYESVFDKYVIRDESGKNLTLVDKGYQRKDNINENLSKISWDYAFRNNSKEFINISGYSYVDYIALDGDQIVKGNVTSTVNKLPIIVAQFYIDGAVEILWQGALKYFVRYITDAGIATIAKNGATVAGPIAWESAVLGSGIGVIIAGDVYAAHHLFNMEHEIISIIYHETLSNPGKTCYSIDAVTIDGRPIKNGLDPTIDNKCEENIYCHDITVRKEFYAEDLTGNRGFL